MGPTKNKPLSTYTHTHPPYSWQPIHVINYLSWDQKIKIVNPITGTYWRIEWISRLGSLGERKKYPSTAMEREKIMTSPRGILRTYPWWTRLFQKLSHAWEIRKSIIQSQTHTGLQKWLKQRCRENSVTKQTQTPSKQFFHWYHMAWVTIKAEYSIQSIHTNTALLLNPGDWVIIYTHIRKFLVYGGQ